MTIASLVLVALLFVGFGWTTAGNNKSLLLFGSFIVTAIAMAGGYSQSQKVSMILGGSRNEMSKYLTVAALVGVLTVVGTILVLKDQLVLAGDQVQFALPQANLMATLTEGIVSGRLPWGMIIAGSRPSTGSRRPWFWRRTARASSLWPIPRITGSSGSSVGWASASRCNADSPWTRTAAS